MAPIIPHLLTTYLSILLYTAKKNYRGISIVPDPFSSTLSFKDTQA